MEQNLHNHIKGDKAKWVIVFIAIILALIASTASIVMCFRQMMPSEPNTETTEQSDVETNGDEVGLQEFVALLSAPLNAEADSNTVEFPPDPEKEGYNFTGWYWDEACTRKYDGEVITSNISLFAGWEIKTCKVTFNTDGGNEIAPQSVVWNTPVNVITPTRPGGSFLGWYLPDGELYENQPILMDTTLKAKWTVASYTVTFNTDGGSELAEQTIEHGKPVKLSTTTKTGCDFKGWYLPNGMQYTNQGITEDTTLKAKWETKKLSVAFNTNGGVEIADQVVNYGDIVDLPIPEYKGYDFLGWLLPDNTEYTEQKITENTVLTAQWEIKHFTVTFYIDGAVYKEITVDYGTRLQDAADQAEIYARNVKSYRFTNVDLPAGELGDLLIIDDMEVTANAPNKSDRTIGSIKNNWVGILLGCIGFVFLAGVGGIAIGLKRKEKKER